MEENKPSVKWFTETQSEWFIENGIPEWFHGVITRKDAEDLLHKTSGCFLIRVSESRIGYSLSYRAKDRCRHFMIEVLKDQQYSIVGDTRVHRTLDDLVKFHTQSPLYPYDEVLTKPCGQKKNSVTDYEELFENQKIFPKLFQTAVQSSCSNSANSGTTMHSICPRVKPRKSHSLDNDSQMMSFLCNPPPQSGNRLYPAQLEIRTSSTAIAVFSNEQPAIVTPNAVDSYFSNAADHTNCHNIHEEKQDPTPNKPMKTCQNVKRKSVSFMTEGNIAQDFKKMENAKVIDMKTVKNSLGRLGQRIQKNTPPILHHNSKRTSMPEEYKKPPPFAPGFC